MQEFPLAIVGAGGRSTGSRGLASAGKGVFESAASDGSLDRSLPAQGVSL